MTTQELIKGFGNYAIISIWDRYCEENDIDERIYLNLPDEINKAFSAPYDVVLAIILGYIDGSALHPYVAPMIYTSFAAMFAAVEIPEILADKFDFVLGIEREV